MAAGARTPAASEERAERGGRVGPSGGAMAGQRAYDTANATIAGRAGTGVNTGRGSGGAVSDGLATDNSGSRGVQIARGVNLMSLPGFMTDSAASAGDSMAGGAAVCTSLHSALHSAVRRTHEPRDATTIQKRPTPKIREN